ncbi:MAG: hypothetical protein H5T84_07560 [Thermoleophilia bacterium]|nr:hypothetical protein [Thermoleophilia bacterium]
MPLNRAVEMLNFAGLVSAVGATVSSTAGAREVVAPDVELLAGLEAEDEVACPGLEELLLPLKKWREAATATAASARRITANVIRRRRIALRLRLAAESIERRYGSNGSGLFLG